MPCEQHKDCPECARHDAEIRKQERERIVVEYAEILYVAVKPLLRKNSTFEQWLNIVPSVLTAALSDRSEQQTDAPSR